MQEYGGKCKKRVDYMERLWTIYYPEIIKTAVALVDQTADNPEETNLNAIGRILKVEAFLKLTDYYGDIPYFEAGKVYQENIVKPKYDNRRPVPFAHLLVLQIYRFMNCAYVQKIGQSHQATVR